MSDVSDDTLAAAALETYDVPSHSTRLVPADGGKRQVRDCRAALTTLDTRTSAGGWAGGVVVHRAVVDHETAIVFLVLAPEGGYCERDVGLVAIARLGGGVVRVDAAGPWASGCASYAGVLTRFGLEEAILAPEEGTGENGPWELTWDVLVARSGRLQRIGAIRAGVATGVLPYTIGQSVATMQARAEPAPDGLWVTETWTLGSRDESRPTRQKVVRRKYQLVHGTLVASPSGDPHE